MGKGMNGLQANICLLCVTLCWSTEVIIFACIPSNVEPFATTCITTLIGGALLIHYIFWTRISKTDYSLKNGRNILKHLALIGICSVVVVAIITPAVAAAYPEVDHMLFARSVFFNQIVFPIALGIPLSILMQEELGFKPFGRIRKNLS